MRHNEKCANTQSASGPCQNRNAYESPPAENEIAEMIFINYGVAIVSTNKPRKKKATSFLSAAFLLLL